MKNMTTAISQGKFHAAAATEEPSRRRVARTGFFLIQLANLLLVSIFVESASIWVFALSGLISVCAYVRLIRSELHHCTHYATPFVCFLISGAMHIGLPSFWAVANEFFGVREGFQFVLFDARDWILHGQQILILGDLLFIFGYMYLGQILPTRSVLPVYTEHSGRSAYVALLISWSCRILTSVAGTQLGELGQLAGYLSRYGIIAAILLMLLRRRSFNPVPTWAIATVVTVEVAATLQGYMKEATILILSPFFITALPSLVRKLADRRSSLAWLKALTFGTLGLVVLVWLFAYSELRRPEFWDAGPSAGSRSDAEVEVAASAYTALLSLWPSNPEFQIHRLPDGGFWRLFTRQADVLPAGWVASEIKDHGPLGGEFLRSSLISLIPRVAWPGKPDTAHGRTIAVMLGQARSEDTANTSTAVGGMASGLLLDLGWPWLIVGMTVAGALLRGASAVFLPQMPKNPFAAIASIALFYDTLRHFEGTFTPGIEVFFYIFVVFYPLMLAWNLFYAGGSTVTRPNAA